MLRLIADVAAQHAEAAMAGRAHDGAFGGAAGGLSERFTTRATALFDKRWSWIMPWQSRGRKTGPVRRQQSPAQVAKARTGQRRRPASRIPLIIQIVAFAVDAVSLINPR
jgi:hypothetical protein